MKTYEEINEKIKQKKAVVFTAEEIIEVVKEKGVKKTVSEVDVVTTGTFGPMCSSGVFINLGHTKPRMKIQKAYLNNVPAYSGLAAVDLYIGATEIPEDDPANKDYPGKFLYGGGHVIEDLVSGKDVLLKAIGYGTDCYPRKEIKTWINIKDLNEAILFNPRNSTQNYNVAVNLSSRTIYTYMGVLKPNLGNATYCSCGQLSPLLNDPYFKTIGIGTRIFLGGGIGYVAWHGTQHTTEVERTEKGIPKEGAGTLAVIGDLKQMSSKWLVGASIRGYGVSLFVGIGIPIPILNEEILYYTLVRDEDIFAPVIDYGYDYPNLENRILCYVNYKELRSGEIEVMGKKVPTASLASYFKAREIANILKSWIKEGKFYITKPVELLPSAGSKKKAKPLIERVPKGDEII